MTRSLIIVESPAKAKTIQKYLGKNYVVLASKGHIRDLPKSGLQVDVEHDYKPHYEVLEDHKSVVTELKKAAKEVESIYLAPDPDREGEAIAWHIAHELKNLKKPLQRIEFHEITKKGVQHGIEHPRQVDEARFNAQQARRILDRLIGYELSPVLWKRLCRRVNGHYLSAGRVQSAALRLIVDREDDIRAFQPQEYWPVTVDLLGKNKPGFVAALVEAEGRKVITPSRDRVMKPAERVVASGAESDAITKDLRGAQYKVAAVEKKERRRRAPPPYITSSLQRDASSRLGFSASRTMQVAQRLYEGIDVGAEGPVGLITYMRTDSTRLSADAVEAARDYIGKRFGKAHVPEKPNFFKTKSSAQDAHEAIRPTATDHHPDAIKKHLKPDEYKVYKLIWERFIACQMSEALYDQTTVSIEAAAGAKKYGLRVSGQVLKFSGWLEAQGATAEPGAEIAGEESVREESASAETSDEEKTLPELKVGEALHVVDPPGVRSEQKFTQPPARYNEGTLVKALEDLGIGRPSTYAEIVSKVLSRDYVEKKERQLVPTKLGTTKTHGLQKSFPEVVDYEFTAKIEKELDEVEAGTANWVKLVDRIYKPFKKEIDHEMKAKEPGVGWPRPAPSDRVCDKCGSPMVRRWGPGSDYYACTAYPTCKNIVDENPAPPPEVFKDRKCPKCGRDLLVKSRRGSDEKFLSCSGWKKKDPDCDYTSPMPTGIVCPKCGGEVVKIGAAKGRRPFWGCSNWRAEDEKKKCDFRLYQPPVLEPCPKCAAKFLVQAGGKTRPVLKCIKEGCGFEKPFTPSDEDGALAAGADDAEADEKPTTASKRPPARKSKRATSPPDATAS
jgi:DNA topoisomerase-1